MIVIALPLLLCGYFVKTKQFFMKDLPEIIYSLAEMPELKLRKTHLINTEAQFRHLKTSNRFFLLLTHTWMHMYSVYCCYCCCHISFSPSQNAFFSQHRFHFIILFSLLTPSAELWSTLSFVNESALPGCVYWLACAVTFMLLPAMPGLQKAGNKYL